MLIQIKVQNTTIITSKKYLFKSVPDEEIQLIFKSKTIINLAGIGLGNGWFVPEKTSRYAKYLYSVSKLLLFSLITDIITRLIGICKHEHSNDISIIFL